MKLKEAYKVLQENCGIEVGDTVKVLRNATKGELGWDVDWLYEMDEAIGKTYRVEVVTDEGITLHIKKYNDNYNYYAFPFFVLEKIKSKSKVPGIISTLFEGLDFGCMQQDVIDLVQELVKFKIELDEGMACGSFSYDTTCFGEYQKDVDKLLHRLLKLWVTEKK